MKKIYTLVFAALCAAVVLSCNKETLVETTADEQGTTPTAQTILNPVTLTFETPSPSKVSIDDQGVASWEEGDQVKIICFDAEGKAKPSEPVTVVDGKITATVEDAEVYYAVYPASATIDLVKDGEVDKLKVTIATKQDGTFKNACYYAAKTTKAAKTFNFKAISGILKFQADPAYKRADIRDVEKIATRHAFAQTETCTFDAEGKVTVTPVANSSSMIKITLDGNGTYYAAICGNAMNEAGFRFSKYTEEEDLGYEPGVFYNNLIKYTPATIKNFGKLTDKIVTDVYVSPEGDGTKDGLSAATAAPASDLAYKCLGDEQVSYTAVKGLLSSYTGVWNCFRRDGLTIHFAEGEYSDAFTVAGDNSSFELTLQGEEGAVLKGANTVSATREGTSTIIKNLTFTSNGAKALSVTSGVCNLENCNFIGCTTTSGNGAALVMDVTAQVTAKNCVFQKNKASNGPALCLNSGDATSDDFVIFSAENCVFGGKDKTDAEEKNFNEATAAGGAVLIAGNANGGQMRFNNCRFSSNKAKTNGAAVYCNNGTALLGTIVLFNGCTFYKNVCSAPGNPSGYSVYANTGSRMAFNNCTWNVANKANGTNGCDIVLKGHAILANSTVWGSGATGPRALAHIGTKKLDTFATIVNSLLHMKNSTEEGKITEYQSLFLSSDYYLKMSGSIYGDLSNYNDSAKEGKHYVFTNCVNRGVETDAPKGAVNKEVAKDGVMQQYYTYTFNKTTYPDFTPMKLSAVKDAVKGTAGIGEIFDAWLTEIGAYDKDIMGNARNADAMSPGSIQVSWSN